MLHVLKLMLLVLNRMLGVLNWMKKGVENQLGITQNASSAFVKKYFISKSAVEQKSRGTLAE